MTSEIEGRRQAVHPLEMSEPDERKTHRLVHWDPHADASTPGSRPPPPPPPRRRYTRLWLILLFLGLLLLGWRMLVVWQEVSAEAEQAEPGDGQVSEMHLPEGERPAPTGDREGMQAARERASLLRSTARIEAANRADSAALLNIERLFVQAERAAEGRDFAGAEHLYRTAEEDLNELLATIRSERSARLGIEALEKALAADSAVAALFADELASVFSQLREAQTALAAGRSLDADSTAKRASQDFSELQEAAVSELDRLVRTGQVALSEGEAAKAKQVFETVLEANPDDERARIGRLRSETIEAVRHLIAEGDALSAVGNLQGAFAAYQAAAELDSYSVEATQKATRMARARVDAEVDAGLAQVDRLQEEGQWEEAKQQLQALVDAFPDHRALADRMNRFEQDRRQNQIRQSLIAARIAEESRNWERARQLYEDLVALGIDRPEVIDGLERTGRVMRALQAFHFNMRAATAAAEQFEYQEAITRFNEAMANKPDYLELSSAQADLEGFLTAQSQPVAVRFETDGLTLVSYFGPMNRAPAAMAREASIELLPGRYRVRGTRRGYRPVEFELVVRADQTMDRVRVVANERER